jgi:hypothetical protein
MTARLQRGEVINVSQLEELPDEAAVDFVGGRGGRDGPRRRGPPAGPGGGRHDRRGTVTRSRFSVLKRVPSVIKSVV